MLNIGGIEMALFDRDVKNSSDAMFDRNHDGVLDPFEQTMRYTFLEEMLDEDEDDDDEFISSDSSYDDILDEIEDMDEDEAREYLESEGYDPDDFDF